MDLCLTLRVNHVKVYMNEKPSLLHKEFIEQGIWSQSMFGNSPEISPVKSSITQQPLFIQRKYRYHI